MTDSQLDPRASHVLDFWFGVLDGHGLADAAHNERWWKKDPNFDELLRSQFLDLYDAIVDRKCEAWLDTPRGRLAYVIVLDQFSRNMFRDTSSMFSADAQALSAALDGIERGDDQKLVGQERVFLYMPLMHSEQLSIQNECVQLFTAFRDASSGPLRDVLDNNLKFAIAHRDIVAKWGRFPHRNALLDRTSTGEELAFLEQPGSSF